MYLRFARSWFSFHWLLLLRPTWRETLSFRRMLLIAKPWCLVICLHHEAVGVFRSVPASIAVYRTFPVIFQQDLLSQLTLPGASDGTFQASAVRAFLGLAVGMDRFLSQHLGWPWGSTRSRVQENQSTPLLCRYSRPLNNVVPCSVFIVILERGPRYWSSCLYQLAGGKIAFVILLQVAEPSWMLSEDLLYLTWGSPSLTRLPELTGVFRYKFPRKGREGTGPIGPMARGLLRGPVSSGLTPQPPSPSALSVRQLWEAPYQ